MAFWADDAQPNDDMWATAGRVARPRSSTSTARVMAFSDETIEPLALDAPASVPWWRPPDTDLHTLLVHMGVETARHLGHMDILREQLDGAAGLLEDVTNLPDVDEAWWQAYVGEAAQHRRRLARRLTPTSWWPGRRRRRR